MKRIRLWRLQRSYRRIARLEHKIGFQTPEVTKERIAFAVETYGLMHRGMIARHLSRQKRRDVLRQLVKGQAA